MSNSTATATCRAPCTTCRPHRLWTELGLFSNYARALLAFFLKEAIPLKNVAHLPGYNLTAFALLQPPHTSSRCTNFAGSPNPTSVCAPITHLTCHGCAAMAFFKNNAGAITELAAPPARTTIVRHACAREPFGRAPSCRHGFRSHVSVRMRQNPVPTSRLSCTRHAQSPSRVADYTYGLMEDHTGLSTALATGGLNHPSCPHTHVILRLFSPIHHLFAGLHADSLQRVTGLIILNYTHTGCLPT